MDIAKGLIFQELQLSKETLDERIVCQKKIYLLQEKGIDLGYTFGWYTRGPYSESLAKYIGDNFQVLIESNFELKLKNDVVDKIVSINKIVDKKGDTELSDTLWYELICSLLYIERNKESWNISAVDQREIFKVLRDQKPNFTELQCDSAWKVLREEGYMQK